MSSVNLSNDMQNMMSTTGKVKNKKKNIRKLVISAMLGAVATVLMAFSIPFPLMPGFIKLDFSELPALIAAFTLGPVSGVAVCLIKNIVNALSSTTGGVGELCNFLIGVAFVLPAGAIYKKHRSFKGALVGSFVGCLTMAIMSVPINYYLVYPVYMKFMPLEGIMAMYQAIYPRVETLLEALMIFNMPFTFFKGLCSVVITFLIYKPLSPIIKGNHSN